MREKGTGPVASTSSSVQHEHEHAEAGTPPHLGTIYLSPAGTPVGRFNFIVDPESGATVEIGTAVAATTLEGVVIGTVVDMQVLGPQRDPIQTDLLGRVDMPLAGEVHDVVMATVQVFHSEALRPVRAGLVRGATAEEILLATGYHRMDAHIPAGVVPLADGSWAKVALDKYALLGPESAHLMCSGLSGQAAKSSFLGVLLRSAVHAGSNPEAEGTTAALVFNVKGPDLINLDREPAAGYELSEDDLRMYEALGLPPTPFPHVDVWAPALPGGESGTRSPREDALPLRWDLRSIWPYLRFFYPWISDNDNMKNFLADFADEFLWSSSPVRRVRTFAQIDAWFLDMFARAEPNEDNGGKGNQTPYKSHHIATLRRAHKLLMSLPGRCGGLLTKREARPGEDLPVDEFRPGQVVVVDVANLNSDVQAVVIARICNRLLEVAEAESSDLGVDHLIVWVDELNTYAPAQGSDYAAVRKVLQLISKQGRYAGISLWGAAQALSKVDELVRTNAATRAVGVTTEAELSTGIYGKLPGGISERLATLPKGQMAVWHYSFRNALVMRFPRPAWMTGKPKGERKARRTPKATATPSAPPSLNALLATLGLTPAACDRLIEGIEPETVMTIIAGADDREEAIARLRLARVPDMRRQALPVTRLEVGDDELDPFGLAAAAPPVPPASAAEIAVNPFAV